MMLMNPAGTSRSRSRAPTPAQAHDSVQGGGPIDLSPGVVRHRRLIVVLVAVAWCAFLAGLVFTSANPVTLNRRQILEADAVVTAQVVDPAAGACRIVRQWTGSPLPAEFIVDGLNDTPVKPGGDWIFPLAKRGDRLEIMPTPFPSAARLVYPATPEVLGQLEAVLSGTP